MKEGVQQGPVLVGTFFMVADATMLLFFLCFTLHIFRSSVINILPEGTRGLSPPLVCLITLLFLLLLECLAFPPTVFGSAV